MKVIAFTADQKFIKIGTDGKSSYWYDTAQVVETTKKLKKDDEVRYKYEKNSEGKNVLTAIEKVGGGPSTASAPAPAAGAQSAPKSSGGFDPAKKAEQDAKYDAAQEAKNTTIRSQAIGKMVGAALISLQGQVDINNVCSVIDTLYAKFDQVIK